MMHLSIPVESSIEILELEPLAHSPLISKVKIKVCYVGDEPNRNKTIITKETATEFAASLRGSPIVAYFNQDTGDFEQHNKEIQINGDTFAIVDVTRPYGFVDLNAAVWFQKFLDDNAVEREYLCTEGYLWTTAYPECQRIIENGNNQSLEFDEKNFSGVWTKQDNSNARFFIINEAIIEKLCILGENYEPCFEGAQIKTEFSLDDQFAEMRKTMYSMVNDLHEVLKEGGNKVPTEYAVEIGSSLWDAIWDKMCMFGNYRIKGIYEEGGQKFAVLQDRNNLKLFRLDFQYDEQNGFVPANEVVEVTETFNATATQYSEEDILAYEAKRAESAAEPVTENSLAEPQTNEPEAEPTEDPATENALQEEEPTPTEDPAPAPTYSLDDIVEYQELLSKYSALEAEHQAMQEELTTLREFKLAADRKEKQAMIDKFYMLSDESKQDVIDHIDTYSLDDIEAKLSVICVRNKVSFVNDNEPAAPTAYNLNSASDGIEEEWIRAVKAKEKSQN